MNGQAATAGAPGDAGVVVPLSEAIAPAAMLLGGVPLLTGLVLAAARYVAVGTI